MKNRKIALCLLIAVAVAGNVAAQVPEPARVEGVVTQAGTGVPVASAVVSFITAMGGQLRVTTGADGKFAVGALPPGRYKLSVTKPTFLPPPDGTNSTEITVSAGQHLTGVRLQILKGGVIAGRFADERGSPRGNVRIDLMRYRYVNGRKTLLMAGTSVTNDRGEYRFFGLQPGDYLIRVIATRSRGESLPLTFYPGVTDRLQAAAITVKAGMESTGVNFSLSGDASRRVKVRVLAPPSFPSDGRVSVSLRKSRFELPIASSFEPDSSGAYVFEGVRRGSYVLYARASAGVANSESNRGLHGSTVVVVADEDVDAGTLVLDPGFDVVGRIVSTNPLPIGFDLSRLRVLLRVVEGPLLISPPPLAVNQDGTFALPDLPRGVYRLAVEALPDTLFLGAVRYAARATEDLTFSVEGQPAGPLELHIDGPAGVVRGSVRNATNDLVPNAHVVLIPPRQRRSNPDLFRTATTDSNGTFRIGGITPGEYEALVLATIEPGAYQDPEFLLQYETRATRVTVIRGSAQDLDLRVIAGSP
jgi:hypothetical protein